MVILGLPFAYSIEEKKMSDRRELYVTHADRQTSHDGVY